MQWNGPGVLKLWCTMHSLNTNPIFAIYSISSGLHTAASPKPSNPAPITVESFVSPPLSFLNDRRRPRPKILGLQQILNMNAHANFDPTSPHSTAQSGITRISPPEVQFYGGCLVRVGGCSFRIRVMCGDICIVKHHVANGAFACMM